MKFGKKATLIQLPFFVLPFLMILALLWQNGLPTHLEQNILTWASIAGLASVGDQLITYRLIKKHGDDFLSIEWNMFTRIGGRFGRNGLAAASVMIVGLVITASLLFGVVIAQIMTIVLVFCIWSNTLGEVLGAYAKGREDEGDTRSNESLVKT